MKKLFEKMDRMQLPMIVDVIRIIVGGFIVYKGVLFVGDFHSFTANIQSVGWVFVAAHLAHAIIFIHMVAGSLLALGALTRWMSLLNIPILAGAVVFNYEKMLTSGNNLEFPITVALLVLLIGLFVVGSGKFSLDRYKKREDAKFHRRSSELSP